MPRITRYRTPTAQLISVRLTKLATLYPNCLVGQDHTTDEQAFLHIPVTEADR